MKVLFVHDRFGALAGAEANALATAAEFRRRGHEVGLLHGLGTGRSESDWSNTFSCFCTSLSSAAQMAEARRALEKFAPDLIYVHNLSQLEALEMLLASKVPAVKMVHDHDLYCLRSYKYNCFSRRICTRALSPYCLIPCGGFLKRERQGRFPLAWVSYGKKRREIALNQKFDRLLVATHYMKDELLRNGFEARRIEVRPPVPPRADTGGRSALSSQNRIIYAGQITRGKGVDVLLEALAKVKAPFECHLFGDGHYRRFCEELSQRLGLGGKVHFRGFVSQEELKQHYRDCRVAVMSSVWPEPFGAVGLEAMRFGIPVVAFDAGGIKEWLTDGYNGFLVPWMDCGQFAERVEALLRDGVLAGRMGEHAFQTVRQRFDFPSYIDGLEHLFGELVRSLKPTLQT
ncbi:MAG: glycosyltransferase family 4 protein [Verrucomicrobia bacterium]|nr:glycosyltransferase family 4 protein [Verrucomicrobiota bacterium]